MDLRHFFHVKSKSPETRLTKTKRNLSDVDADSFVQNKKNRVDLQGPSLGEVDLAQVKVSISTPTSNVTALQKCISVKQSIESAVKFSFPLGNDHQFDTIVSINGDDQYRSWFEAFNEELRESGNGNVFKAVVGLDCEWCPPWFRENGEAERVSIIQLYSPHSGALVFSTGKLRMLPQEFLDLLADPLIALVGVNIGGDGARLARDFGCHVNGLVNVCRGQKGKKSMQDLCKTFCPQAFHIDKDSVENGVRMGNWAAWPLTELQIKYAAIDAVLSFAIFLYQNGGDWNSRTSFAAAIDSCPGVESADPVQQQQVVNVDENTASKNAEKNSHFFLMHRNKSIPPPNLGCDKERPQGPPDCLSGVCVVISGVLDSMSRGDMADYVQRHGGKVVKGITKAVTHLLNDVDGTVGPAKLEKCRAQKIPIVGEDAIFNLVRTRSE